MKVQTGNDVFDLGITEVTPTIGIIDRSRRVTDDFGVTTVVQRGYSRTLACRFALATDAVDNVQQRLADLRATSALWIADERFTWLSVDGFYRDFDIDLAVPPLSYCSLNIEGLTEVEPGADPGGDPAPDAQRSTLHVLRPLTITDAALLSSSVPETDAPAWAADTTYAVGQKVVRAHRVFESLIAGNVGNDPISTPSAWLDTGPTNRWAMFDQALGTATTAPDSITIQLPAGAINAIALVDVAGDTVRIRAQRAEAPHYDRTLPVTGGAIPFLDVLGIPSGNAITITIAGSGMVSVGTLLVGNLLPLGVTEASPSASIIDFSRKDTDDFGEVTIVKRAFSKRMAAKALIRSDAVDLVADRLASLRALPCLWLGDEGQDAITVYGFYREFGIEVGQSVSKLSLSIEGLSTASKLLPLQVDWTNVTDNTGTRPADNATVGAPIGTPVAGVPAEELVGRVDNLYETYGDSAAAEEFAQAAAAARDAAVLAKQNAETARDQSAAARGAAEAARQTAIEQAQAAGESATASSASASVATSKAGEASTSAGQAASSRDQAGGYASSAATSASTAASARDTAQGHAQAASNSATSAAASQDAAGQSASAAQGYSTTAQTRASEALTYRDEAVTSASNANGSAATASQQAGLAAGSASAAGGSASAAQSSASVASTKADEAGASATVATSAKQDAIAARDGAQASAGNASGSAGVASGHAAAALEYRNTTATYRDQASGSANSASLSAQSASQSAAQVDADVGAISQRVDSVEATANGASASASQSASAIAGINGQLASRLVLDSVAGNNRAQIKLYASANGGAGVDIIGDTTFKGKVVIDNGTIMIAQGIGFGSAGQFLEWVGPSRPLEQCTEAAALRYVRTDGSAYFKGAFLAGDLRSGQQNPSLGASVTADTGTIGSNGGEVVAVASWTYVRETTTAYPATSTGRANFISAAQAAGATDQGGGLWMGTASVGIGDNFLSVYKEGSATPSTVNINTGSRTFRGIEPVPGDAPGNATTTITAGGSVTYADPERATRARSFQAVLARGGGLNSPTTQRVGIVTTE